MQKDDVHWLILCCLHFHTYFQLHCTPPNAQAYHLNITYPRYMFLTYGWYKYKWFAEEVQGDECTPAQRESVLPYSLAILQDEFLTNLSTTTDIGIVSQFCYEYNYSIASVLDFPWLLATRPAAECETDKGPCMVIKSECQLSEVLWTYWAWPWGFSETCPSES